MGYKIIWSQPATESFRVAVEYLRERNVTAAETTRLAILERVEQLSHFPLLGAVYDWDPSSQTREIVCGVYRIFYRVDAMKQQVEVLVIWHGSRAEPQIPV